MFKIVGLFLVSLFAKEVLGHGYMVDPINRSSIWRVNSSFPPNYEDNQNFCGGFQVQFQQNGGKCGICGDNYQDPRPRANENGGTFGLGYIVKTYAPNTVIDVVSELTANHLGYFQYSLCDLKNSGEVEEDECFIPLMFENGSDKHPILGNDYVVHSRLMLPEGFTCEHCVLRWHYNSGNSWGVCEDGTQAMGCGDQEQFRSCSDIAIM